MPPTVLVSKPVKRRDAVVLVHHRRAGAQVGEGGDRARARAVGRGAARRRRSSRCSGTTASLSCGREEALAQAGVGEQHARLGGRRLAVEEAGLHAREVELRALGLAAARPGDDRAVARAHELLELRLGLAQRARGGVGALGAELVRLVLGDARQAQRGAARRAPRASRSGWT